MRCLDQPVAAAGSCRGHARNRCINRSMRVGACAGGLVCLCRVSCGRTRLGQLMCPPVHDRGACVEIKLATSEVDKNSRACLLNCKCNMRLTISIVDMICYWPGGITIESRAELIEAHPTRLSVRANIVFATMAANDTDQGNLPELTRCVEAFRSVHAVSLLQRAAP